MDEPHAQLAEEAPIQLRSLASEVVEAGQFHVRPIDSPSVLPTKPQASVIGIFTTEGCYLIPSEGGDARLAPWEATAGAASTNVRGH